MKIARLIFCACLIPLAATAQVRKCVDSMGKTVYSDVVCADTAAKATTVDTSKNSLDYSGMREQANSGAAKASAAQAKERADAKQHKRDNPTDACGNPIDLSHKPSARLANEYKKCTDARVREYNRPSY